jgi:hypothetical protein
METLSDGPETAPEISRSANGWPVCVRYELRGDGVQAGSK